MHLSPNWVAMLLACASPCYCFAQPLTIVYDAQTNQFTYLCKGKPIAKPRTLKGEPVVLKILHYNNYLYDVRITETKEEIQVGAAKNPWGSIQDFGFSTHPPSPLPAQVPSTKLDLPSAPTLFSTVGYSSAVETRMQQLKDAATDKLEYVNAAEKRLNLLENSLDGFKKRLLYRTLAQSEVAKIKMNPAIPPDKIKAYAESFFQNALNLKNTESATLDDVLTNNNDKLLLANWRQFHQQNMEKYDLALQQIQALSGALETEGSARYDLMEVQFTMTKTLENAPTLHQRAANLQQTLDSLWTASTTIDIRDLTALWYDYEALHHNDFSTTYQSTAEGDSKTLQVSFLKKNHVENPEVLPLVELPPLKIQVYGGFKINTSLGVNFGHFFKKHESYYVRDSSLLSQTEDAFLPMISTMLHFYRETGRDFSIGGTIGAGFPLTANSGLQNVHFFAGPSVFFGQADRLVLNLGLMGGKVKRLAKGYQIAEKFDGDNESIPLHDLYELGYFVGLSFNLSK